MPDSQEKNAIHGRLEQLMAEQRRPLQGVSFVRDDGSFGLRAESSEQSLYQAYFLIDQLARAGLFARRQNPKADIDEAFYTLSSRKQIPVYDEAVLEILPGKQIQVTIKTPRPVTAILKCLEDGEGFAREDNRQADLRKQEYERERQRDREREKMPPVFGFGNDRLFVEAYVKMRVREDMGYACGEISHKPPNEDLIRLCDDHRPRVQVNYLRDPAKDYLADNDFVTGLGKVFRGFCAVSPHQFSASDGEGRFDLAGTPSRLAADILDHDIEGAKRACAAMGGGAAMQAEIHRRAEFQADVHKVTQPVTGVKPVPAVRFKARSKRSP